MSRWSAGNDATTLHYRVQFQNRWDWKRVYIDTDRTSTTGFRYAGIGSEYLIENGSLSIYTGTGLDWSWSRVRDVSVIDETDPDAIAWTLFRSDLGSTTATDLVFEVQRVGEPARTGYRHRHEYSATDGGILDYGEENDSTRLYFHADFASGWTWNQVFIDGDSSESTGYRIGGTGSEWMLENNELFRYTGDGVEWSWSRITEPDGSSAAHPAVDGTMHQWWVWRTTIGEQNFDKESNRIVLRGDGGAPLYQTPIYDFEASW